MMTCKDGRGPTQENKGAKEICASTTRKAITQISAERESERAQQKTQARRVSKMEERQLDKKKRNNRDRSAVQLWEVGNHFHLGAGARTRRGSLKRSLKL